MKILKISLIILLVILLILIILFVFARSYIIKKVETIVLTKVETAIGKEISIETITYLPPQSVSLKNIYVHEKGKPPESGMLIRDLSLNMNVIKFFSSKVIAAKVKFKGMEKDSLKAQGNIFFTSYPCKNRKKPFETLSCKSIDISKLSLESPTFAVKNISGGILFNKTSVSAPNISFLFEKMPHKLSFNIKDLDKKPLGDIKIEGKQIKARGSFIKQNNVVKIKKISMDIRDSHLELEGEISEFDNPFVLLYGNLDLTARDLCYINTQTEKVCALLEIRGKLHNKLHIQGYIKDPSSWEIGIKGRSSKIMITDYGFKDVSFNANLKNAVITIPFLRAYPYNGTLNASSEIDLSRGETPYTIRIKLNDIDINSVVRDSPMKKKTIYGRLSLEFILEGKGNRPDSIKGKGYIDVKDANLGPMPILSPLVGRVYGVLRTTIPAMKTVEITKGYCDFTIRNRKIRTDNLILTGDVLNIYANGYIDFDKNLDFAVENEFKETKEGAQDFQKGLIEIIAGFGKFIGKARLTGTLDKPKWKFEYFTDFKKDLGGQIGTILKGLFE